MARITVEDCEKVVKNRFDLVILAAQRTRQILAGDRITVDVKDEKKPVIALREIAAQTVSIDSLKENIIKGFRVFTPEEYVSEEVADLAEEDTYNPYADLEMSALESSNISIIEDIESDNSSEEDQTL